jgi:putative membrane protein
LKTSTLLSVAAIALAACGPKAETASVTVNTTAPDEMTAPQPGADQAFANTAASSDAFEIAAAKLALTNASSPAIKKFAQMMIDAHTESTAKLEAAAGGATPAIVPDPALTAEQQRKLDMLGTLRGADFDRAYAAGQIGAHEETLAALKAYSANGTVPQFKAFATQLVPIVTAHLNMAKGLKV